MEDGGGSGGGDGFDGGFHRNEAISAVQDEDQYLGEEDYEDYDDLYNDVNVGEGFLQSVPQRDDLGYSGHEENRGLERQQKQPQPPAPPLPPVPPPVVQQQVAIPGIAGGPKPPDAVGGGSPAGDFQDMGYRGPNEPMSVRAPPMPIPGGVRPDMVQFSQKPPENQGQYGNPGFGNEGFVRPVGGGGGVPGGGGGGASSGVGVGGAGAGGPPVNYNTNVNGGGGTILFVGDLHWWTTDSDLESELCKYGQVKEVKFFDEKASGKSKGYCQAEFYDPMAAAACKEGMNGHLFNGRPCVVAFASPYSVRRMGEAQVSKNLAVAQSQSTLSQGKGRGGSGIPTGANYGGRGGPGGNWGRGGGGPGGGRGNMGNIRNRMGPAGGRGIMGNGGMVNPPLPPVLHPGGMMGQGFDPTGYGAAMGRMGAGFGGFPGGPAAAPFPGMMPSFPPMVAPHVNPAFFGRGMAPGGMGMWPDPNAAGWGGEEQTSYGEDAASDHQYGDGSHGKDRVSDRDWSGAPDRKYRDDRERDMGTGQEWTEKRHHDERDAVRDRERERERDRERENDRERERERDRDRDRERERERERERDRYRDNRDRHGDPHRHRDRDAERDEWDRGRSSRPRSKSREFEHSKRRRITPERL